MILSTEGKLICGEYKLWKQPPKRFVRLIKTLAKKIYICGVLFVVTLQSLGQERY